MAEFYSGFKELVVSSDLINKLYEDGEVTLPDKRHTYYPNMYIELKSSEDPKHTALCKVSRDGDFLVKLNTKQEASNIRSRNREQAFALDALLDDEVPVVVLSGNAGTGKSIFALAVAMTKLDQKKYQKVILTKPMSQVGKHQLGALPGSYEEKFSPYLLNYKTNLEQLVGVKNTEDLLFQLRFEIIPIQLIRGASFNKCFIIADEVQTLNHHEMLTLGTRIGEGTKLVLLGDLNQRDEPIAKEKTGLYKVVNDNKTKHSPLVTSIELIKNERSPVSRLFSSLFEEE